MTIVLLILQFLALAGILALGYLVRDLPRAYVEEKGRNLATKEDIADITGKVEAVKAEYVTAVEHLRSDLRVIVAQRTALETQAHEASLDLFDSTVRLIGLLRLNLGDLPSEEGTALVKYQARVSRLFDRIFVQYHRLLLYTPEGLVANAAEGVAEAAMELRGAFPRAFGPIKLALVEEDVAFTGSRTPQYEAAVAKSDEAMVEYRAVVDPLRQRLWSAYQEYLGTLREDIRSRVENRGPFGS